MLSCILAPMEGQSAIFVPHSFLPGLSHHSDFLPCKQEESRGHVSASTSLCQVAECDVKKALKLYCQMPLCSTTGEIGNLVRQF